MDLAEVEQAVRQASELRAEALEARRQAFRQARDAGATLRDIAAKTGVSAQRVSKILDGNAPPKRRVPELPPWDGRL